MFNLGSIILNKIITRQYASIRKYTERFINIILQFSIKRPEGVKTEITAHPSQKRAVGGNKRVNFLLFYNKRNSKTVFCVERRKKKRTASK